MAGIAAQLAHQQWQQDLMARGAWQAIQMDRTVKAGLLNADLGRVMANANRMNAMEAGAAFAQLKDRANQIGGAPGSAALTSIGLAEQTFSLGDVSGAAGHLSGFHQTTGAMLGTVASTNDPDGWDKALSSLQSETPPISPPASSGWDDLLRQLRSTYTTTDWARVISGAPTPKLADVLPAITSTVPQGWQPTDWSLQQPSPQLSSIFSPVPEILGAHPPIGRDLVRSAEKMLGTPYVHGGKRPGGFDCSGLTQYACRQNGIAIGPDTYHQIKAGRPVRFDHAKPGDLVFFDTIGAFNHDPSHVGMVVGNGKMIVAPHTGDVVKYEQMNTPYWRQRLVGVRRVTPPAP